MNDYFIRCEDLSYIYEDTGESAIPVFHPALDGVSLNISRGEYLAILGHNGSGKSTLAKLISMILTPKSGKIYIDGTDITDETLGEDAQYELRRRVGMVFQNPDNQLVATVVEEDVAFGPENLGIPSEEIRKRVDDALSLVGMQDYKRHAPHKLSGGQKQRVAIAGIIAMHPDIIIFDEATAMLDPIGRRDVLAIMERLNREDGITVINITHYMDEAARADRIVVINDGKTLLDGTPDEVFSNVPLLHEVGLEAPQSAELIHALREAGLEINSNAITPEGCRDLLIRLLSGGDR
ncbi:MAG: energy-coupling factor transporter ATPase [Clostridia bacterium]|nr:energy-coupling factor transporter ATPase [Clostridia bacterium]